MAGLGARTRGPAFVVAMVLMVGGLVASLGTLSAEASHYTSVVVWGDQQGEEKNPHCVDLGLLPADKDDLKSGSNPTGTQTVTAGGVTVTFTISGQTLTAWTLVSGGGVTTGLDAVIVKGGDVGANAYMYNEATSDTGALTTPTNQGISHVQFCYDAEPQTGTVIIEKQTLPDGHTEAFQFTSQTQSLNGTLTDGQSFSATLPAGPYSVVESPIPGGWALTGLSCSDQSGGSSGQTSNATASISLAVGETVKCTFTNTLNGRIVVEKQTVPDGHTQTFSFTGAIQTTLADGQAASASVAPGTHAVTEGTQSGWGLESIACLDDTENSSGQTITGTATFEVAPGETVTCVFTNVQQRVLTATIIVQKETIPDASSEQFDFTGAVGAALSDGQSASAVVDPTQGPFSVTETPESGWALTSVTCNDTDSVGQTATGTASVGQTATGTASVGQTATGTATFNVTADETVICTFTNTQQGRIIVEKQTLPDGHTQTFSFTGALQTTLADGQTADAEVAPGSHDVTEGRQDGWTLTDIDCDDDDSTGQTSTATATFDVDPGETVTCTFTNTEDQRETPLGTLIVQKVIAEGSDDQSQEFDFDVDGLDFGPALGHGDSHAQSVTAGSHSVQETVPSGWDTPSFVCSTQASGTGQSVTVFVPSGGAVICTFVNNLEEDGPPPPPPPPPPEKATIVVEKQTLPNGSPQTFIFTGAVAGAISDGQTIGAQVDGGQTYTATELLPDGWVLTDVDCDDTDSVGSLALGTATFVVAAGETVKCTFTNTQNGSIVVEKQTDPDGSGAEFDFSGALTATLGDGQSASVEVAPDVYGVTEASVEGWELESIECSDGESGGDPGLGAAIYVVGPGETVTCVFTNVQLPTVLPKPPVGPDVVLPDHQERPTTTVLPRRILPFTGTDPSLLVVAAGILMGLGSGLSALARRGRDETQ